jgi:leader peptidase (prepilin peptidase)/N-methyltransferase
MIALLWGILGLLVAACLNHLADRLPGHEPVRPAPSCPACGKPYRRRQWLAVLAGLVGSRRCGYCGASLPARRYALELGLALLYGLLAWRYGLAWTLLLASFHASVLALVVVTDLETRKVPNAAVLPAIAVTLASTLLSCPRCLGGAVLGGVAAFLLFLLLTFFYMGFGDVILAAYIGLIAGWPRVLVCLLVGVLAGGVAAAILLLTGRLTRRSYMAYAPYLALGGALVLFYL